MYIMQAYKSAWQFLMSHKSILLVLYFFNLVLALLAIGPIRSYMESVFSSSDAINILAERFDYNIIMDWLNQYGLGVNMSISSIFSFFILYIFWSTFATAGFLGMYQNSLSEGKSKIKVFWASGINHFFRFLRINIYILLIYAFIISLMFFFFTKDGLNVFNMESELFLIKRFWVLLTILIILGFFISIFRDIARSKSIINNPIYLFDSNISALKEVFRPSSMLLSLMNMAFLLIISAIYFLLKDAVVHSLILAFVLSQIYLLFRLCYRVVRGCSFLEMGQE